MLLHGKSSVIVDATGRVGDKLWILLKEEQEILKKAAAESQFDCR